MKKMITSVVAFSLIASTAQANDLLQGLLSSQTDGAGSRTTTNGGSSGTPTQVTPPSVPGVTSSATSQNCPSSGQTTLPLKYVAAMMRTKGSSLQLSHDAAQGQLNVRGGDFLSNCNGMLEWGLRTPTTDFPNYVVELKIKGCGGSECEYKVMEVNTAKEQVEKTIKVKPDFAGFQQCLRETGVVDSTGAVRSDKMVIRDLDISFNGVENSGNVWFGSHLPAASALYKKQSEKDCYYMEDIRQGGYAVYSPEDSERMRLDEQAQLICDSGNYRHIADFLERYSQYQTSLGAIRDELILKDYKKLAELIQKGEKLETQDYSVLADFQRYIVDPLTTRISDLHQKIGSLPSGQERRLKEEELKGLMRQLASYRSAPFITEKDMDKLMAKGLFDEAAQVNVVHLTAKNYGRLGANEGGVLVTPRVARQRISDGKQQFQRNLVARKEQFEVQTGRLTGRSEYFQGLASQHRKNIQIRTSNYQLEINDEVARITPPAGYCFRYFRNTQKCAQDSMQRIQELRALLERYNNSDAAIANDLEAKARTFREWEQQGERYIAAQSEPQTEAPTESTTPARDEAPRGPAVEAPRADRAADAQAPMYQFPVQNLQLQQSQMPTQQPQFMPGMQYNPQMQGQQFSGQFQNQIIGAPWGQQQYQNFNPYMPQMQQPMGHGLQHGGQGYTFNFQGAMGQQQQPFYQPTNNPWGQQQNPYQWGAGGMGFQAPFGMQQPWMTQTPQFSQNMGLGMQFYR